MTANLISCDFSVTMIYKHSGVSTTILASYAAPSYYCSGLASNGTNLISCHYTVGSFYVMNNATGAVLSTIVAPETYMTGLTFDGTNLMSCYAYGTAGMIYKHSGLTSTILTSFSKGGKGGGPTGLAWDGSNLISCVGSTIYKHSGFSSAILTSFSSPARDAFGLTFDGVNLLSCDKTGGRIYTHSGISSTILSSIASPDAVPGGLTFDSWNSTPSAPTSLLCEEAASPQGVTDLTPEFSAIGNDDSGDTLTHAYVQVNTSSAFTGTTMWDSGWIDIVNFTAGGRCDNISYAGTALTLTGDTYYWRIAFKDDDGEVGEWSAASSFRMQNVASKALKETLVFSDVIARKISALLIESIGISQRFLIGVGDLEQYIITLDEAFSLRDQLGIGGVWDEPASRLYAAILSASFYMEVAAENG